MGLTRAGDRASTTSVFPIFDVRFPFTLLGGTCLH